MIEKLKPNEDKVFKTETGECLTIPELWVPKPISDKINELVDAVNNQQIQLNNHECRLLDLQNQINEHDQDSDWYDDPKYREQPADPYAEQRKWIGCVCRFWYDNPNDTLLDYLDKIQTGKNGVEYYAKESGDWFSHCEPVKPDDDIIYQGE